MGNREELNRPPPRSAWRAMGLSRWGWGSPPKQCVIRILWCFGADCRYLSGSETSKGGSRAIPESKAGQSDLPGLPVELLQKIFTYCAEPNTSHSTNSALGYPAWIGVTHVCSYWRAVALNHHSLWASIDPNLSTTWIKILMERSNPVPVDVDLRLDDATPATDCSRPGVDDAIALLADCARLRSLKLVGHPGAISAALDSMRTPAPVDSLTLSIFSRSGPRVLPEGLFGGQAPIKRINFAADPCVVAPAWLLRGITHFTSGEQIPLPALLAALRQMPALIHFKLQHCRAHWDPADAAPATDLVPLPHLATLVVRADSPRYFVLLCRSLALPSHAVRRHELVTVAISGWERWASWLPTIRRIADEAGGLQTVHITGGIRKGTFCAWSGGADDTDAHFHFAMEWSCPLPFDILRLSEASEGQLASPFFHLSTLCDALGADCARKLVIAADPECAGLREAYWWRLLPLLPGVTDLELDANAHSILRTAWTQDGAPAVLPALQNVLVAPPKRKTTRQAVMPGEGPADGPSPTGRRGFISRIVSSKALKVGPPTQTPAEAVSGFFESDIRPQTQGPGTTQQVGEDTPH
ncbi:hypothetical protein BC834DRAFT_876819, partial [Gloeopeniophorella convolvens]